MKQKLTIPRSFSRLLTVLIVGAGVLPLAACGFQPLMGKQQSPEVQQEMGQIRVNMIADRSGQILRNYLLDDLTPQGIQGRERYTLLITLNEPRREVALSRDNTASVVSYVATANFTLVDHTARSTAFSGSSSSQSTYLITNSEFATLSSFNAARDRVLQDVSTDMRLQIADFFGRRAALR
jgi:LPS-assembly lipoprotein